ncbi:MAG: YHS domain-containing protein [Ignavibacteria bacterium]|jgi:YHS domain-containing protein|nr:YHS domain-containing protein [Ignavibacteria bacterium]MDH7527742.1 YHS domain-containing protein [Ignavibacteria bacterium]
MKIKFGFIILLAVLIFYNIPFAQEKENKKAKTETKKEIKSELKQVQPSVAKKIWNEVCPVMGEPVDPEVQTVEYNGKVIGFCCKSCIKKFKKDPEKYLKNLSEDGKKFIKQ